ncbi:hypothetical protein CK203_070025 [Vitis vinifera]|uniref:DEK-C domain-containing protein n=1 Tax=Vitis vinifera TaxID=29760 RepID=A0A438EQ68_VITVI|nr:hypothetical protein CK203_070025 [Vitis vinifera]
MHSLKWWSDSDLATRIPLLLHTANFFTTTTSIVFRQLEDYYGVDLSDRKAFIREEIDVFLRRYIFQIEAKAITRQQKKNAEVEEGEKVDEDAENVEENGKKYEKKKKALSRTKKRVMERRDGRKIVDFAGVCVLVLDFGKVFFGGPQLSQPTYPTIEGIILELIAIKLYDP